MNIAALSMMKSHANVRQDVSMALMKKTMDSAEQQNSNLIDKMLVDNKALMQAAEPHKGGSIDLSI